MFKKLALQLSHRLGLVSDTEYINNFIPERKQAVADIPTQLANEVLEESNSLLSLAAARNVPEYFKRTNALIDKLEYGKALLRTEANAPDENVNLNSISVEQLGYRPSGATGQKLFYNPFGLHAFYADNHWAVAAAINIIMTEIRDDGWKLLRKKGLGKQRYASYQNRILNEINAYQTLDDLCKTFLIYKNALINPHPSFVPGINAQYEVMHMPRMWPIINKTTEELEGWKQHFGYVSKSYPANALYHLFERSYEFPFMGNPTLSPALTDIEADIGFGALNNAATLKAGAIGVILSMEDPSKNNPFAQVNMDTYISKVRHMIQTQFSGSRSGYSALVLNYLKGVHKVADIGAIDGSGMKFRLELGKMICILLNIPPEKISISRSQSLQYQASLIEDTINQGFDKAINGLTTRVTDFYNKNILEKEEGITDVIVASNGRYSSRTLNQAQAAKLASETGPIFDVNELREFFKAAKRPSNDPLGRLIIDNSSNAEFRAIEANRIYSVEDPYEDMME